MTKMLVSVLSIACQFGNYFLHLHIGRNALKFFKHFRLNMGKVSMTVTKPALVADGRECNVETLSYHKIPISLIYLLTIQTCQILL